MSEKFSLINTLNNIQKIFPKDRTSIQVVLEKVLSEKLKEIKETLNDN